MANYSINLTDNANGSYTVTDVLRAPTAASGGTQLKVTFADAAGSGGFLNLGEAIQRAMSYALADKVKNG